MYNVMENQRTLQQEAQANRLARLLALIRDAVIILRGEKHASAGSRIVADILEREVESD
jgi:hypothetical protein